MSILIGHYEMKAAQRRQDRLDAKAMQNAVVPLTALDGSAPKTGMFSMSKEQSRYISKGAKAMPPISPFYATFDHNPNPAPVVPPPPKTPEQIDPVLMRQMRQAKLVAEMKRKRQDESGLFIPSPKRVCSPKSVSPSKKKDIKPYIPPVEHVNRRLVRLVTDFPRRQIDQYQLRPKSLDFGSDSFETLRIPSIRFGGDAFLGVNFANPEYSTEPLGVHPRFGNKITIGFEWAGYEEYNPSCYADVQLLTEPLTAKKAIMGRIHRLFDKFVDELDMRDITINPKISRWDARKLDKRDMRILCLKYVGNKTFQVIFLTERDV